MVRRAAGTSARVAATPTQESEYEREASETSCEGCEDQEATPIKPQDPVKRLCQPEAKALEATNDIALGTTYGVDLPRVARIKAQQPP